MGAVMRVSELKSGLDEVDRRAAELSKKRSRNGRRKNETPAAGTDESSTEELADPADGVEEKGSEEGASAKASARRR